VLHVVNIEIAHHIPVADTTTSLSKTGTLFTFPAENQELYSTHMYNSSKRK
jgi:hypothetical protein